MLMSFFVVTLVTSPQTAVVPTGNQATFNCTTFHAAGNSNPNIDVSAIHRWFYKESQVPLPLSNHHGYRFLDEDHQTSQLILTDVQAKEDAGMYTCCLVLPDDDDCSSHGKVELKIGRKYYKYGTKQNY